MMELSPPARISKGQSGGSWWEMVTRAPSERLRQYVYGDYVGYTEHTDTPSRRREFAVPFVVLVIEFGPPIVIAPNGDASLRASHRGGFTGGLDDRFAICEHDGFQHGLQVYLTPIGARLLFNMPMSELSGQSVPIADVLPPRHRNLRERLQEIEAWDDRFDELEATLCDCLHNNYAHTDCVSWAVRRIEQCGGVLDVRMLARDIGYSQKHVTTMFRDHVGIPPKRFARIVRFHRLVTHLRRGGGGTWADLATRFGYYDQPHLVREVRELTGITPTEFRPLTANMLSSL